MSDPLPVPRDKPCGSRPFFWIEKEAARKIRETFDVNNSVCYALAVYTALAELASDYGSATFVARNALIASKAGLSVRKTQEILHMLQEVGLIAIEHRKMDGTQMSLPSQFTVLTDMHAVQEVMHTVPKVMHTYKTTFRAEKVKERERTKKEPEIKGGRFQRPTLEEIKSLFKEKGSTEAEAERFWNYYESNGWKVGRNPMASLPHAVAGWISRSHSRTYANSTTPNRPRPDVGPAVNGF